MRATAHSTLQAPALWGASVQDYLMINGRSLSQDTALFALTT